MPQVILDEALNAPRVIVSITGPAAGQSELDMRRRKLAELDSAGRIFWGISSWTCSVADIHDLVKANGDSPTYVLLFSGGNATSQDREPNEAHFYAATRIRPNLHSSSDWRPMPCGIHVKNVRTKNALALVLGSYLDVESPVKCDFGNYTFFNRDPATVPPGTRQKVASLTHQGRSTVCAVKGSHGARPYYRKLVGVATLVGQYAVWVRT